MAIAVIEMALSTAFGAKLEARDHMALFGENQARYVLTATPARAMAILSAGMEQNIELHVIGDVTAPPL